MFKGSLNLCRQEEFKFYDFYNLINGFKNITNLVLEDWYGQDTEIIHVFSIEKDKVWLKFNMGYKELSINIEADCALDNFNIYYKALENIINLVYKR